MFSSYLVIAGSLVLILSLRYRKADAPSIAYFSPRDWKRAGVLGLKGFTPLGRKLHLIGWVLFILGAFISAAYHFSS